MVVFVIGGSGSGKSEYAEQLAAELMEQETENKELSTSQKDARLVYIATMEPMDQESRQRILRHRAMREGRQFETWEQYTHLEELSFGYKDVLLL